MGRGLSDQQKAILIWTCQHGQPLADAIESDSEAFWYPFRNYQDDGLGVWAAELGRSHEDRPAFGHKRKERDKRWRPYHFTSRQEIQSDTERASVARSITRLEDRGLLKRWKGMDASIGRGRKSGYYYLILTPEGLDLAKSLTTPALSNR